MADKTDRLLNQMQKQENMKVTPIGTEITIPNHSGMTSHPEVKTNLVPYTGANANVDLGSYNLTGNTLTLTSSNIAINVADVSKIRTSSGNYIQMDNSDDIIIYANSNYMYFRGYSATCNYILGNATGQVVNFVAGSAATAPTTAAGVPTTRYGGNTKYCGDPVGWLGVKINGTARKIPYY